MTDKDKKDIIDALKQLEALKRLLLKLLNK
jgi:hypothetical protein